MKKGFTLVETTIFLVIIAIIGIAVITNIFPVKINGTKTIPFFSIILIILEWLTAIKFRMDH